MKYAHHSIINWRLRALAFLMLIHLGLSAAQGEDTQLNTLTLQSAVEYALLNNPALTAIHARYEAARHRIPQAAALPDPRLQLTRFFEPVQTRTGPQENLIALSQGIPWPGTLKHREEKVSAEAEALWYAYLATELSLVREISQTYFEYAYQYKAIDISGENLRLLEDLLPISEENVRVGGNLSSLLRLKVEVEQARDKLDSLEQNRASTAAQLLRLLAGEYQLQVPAWSLPTIPNWVDEELYAKMEATNPELRVHELRIESAEAARELAKLQTRPELGIGINYIQIGEAISPNVSGSGQDPWGIMFSMTLPIHSRKNQAARAEASSQLRANEADFADAFNRLKSQLQTSLIKHKDAARRYQLYKDELIPLAEQAWEISQTSYENGKTGILEVIESERALLKLRLEHWRAAADLWQQQMIIQTLTNAASFNTFREQSYEN